MWYVKLLEYLAVKICPKDAVNAVSFIRNWLRLLKNEFYHTGDIEPMLIIGLATDLYNYSIINQGGGSTLSQFARKTVGLTILHAKNTEDDSIYNSDFTYMLCHENIFDALELDKQFLSQKRQYLLGLKKHKRVKPLTSLSDVNMYIDNTTVLNEIIIVNLLNDFERKTFRELNYQVKANIDNFVPVLNEFLNHAEKPERLLVSLYLYLLPYQNESDSVEQLMDAIRRNSKVLELWERGKQYENEDESNESAKDSLSDCFKEVCQNNSQTIQSKPASINLTLIPRLRLDQLPRYNSDIMRLCNALEHYIEQIDEKRYSFYAHNSRKYKSEVACVVSDIFQNNLLSVSAIISELKKIDISRTDELRTIVDLYDKTATKQTMHPKCKM